MEKTNLTLSELVMEMHDAVANRGKYAKGDTLVDVHEIIRTHEECLSAVEEEYVKFSFLWCIRQEGTLLTTSMSKIMEWGNHYLREEDKSFYEITCEGRKWSIRNAPRK